MGMLGLMLTSFGIAIMICALFDILDHPKFGLGMFFTGALLFVLGLSRLSTSSQSAHRERLARITESANFKEQYLQCIKEGDLYPETCSRKIIEDHNINIQVEKLYEEEVKRLEKLTEEK